ncbi:MAG: nuclear transport factor 2 family protein [Rhodospirillaceae bacterium]
MIKHLIIAAALITAPIAAHAIDLNGGTEAQYAAVQKFHDDTVARFNAGDLEGSVNDYLERLVVAHTKRMELTGRDDLEESWGKAFASSSKPYLVSEIIAMEVNGDDIGDWSYIICDYASVVVDTETGTQVGEGSNGRYIALLEMTADGWKVLLDIDNGAEGAAPHLEEQLLKQLNL